MYFFKILIALTALLFISCSKDPALFTLNNLNNNHIGCFGHAGMGSKSVLPVNTFESLKMCLDKGADGTEMDIQVTKDSVLVILHDETLSKATTCDGKINEMDWADIKDCKRDEIVFKKYTIISFDEFIEKIKNPHQYTFTLDCKSRFVGAGKDDYFRLFARTLVKTIEKYNLGNNVFIENAEISFLNNIKQLMPDAKLFYLAEDFDYAIIKVNENALYGISIDNAKATGSQIIQAHHNNIKVTLFGVVNDENNYLAVEKCPDFIQTDDINYLIKIFERYKR